MRFFRDKATLLAALAMLAPLPLPFNEVVGWPSVLAFCFVVALFWRRALAGQTAALPNWLMNVLGLAYLPFLFADLTVLRQGRILQPLIHLAFYALAIKFFAIRREKDKWHLLLGVFFLFLASMGTSVHPAVLVYLVAFSGLAVLTLVRFAGYDALAANPAEGGSTVPAGRVVLAILGVALLATIPLFFFLPRLKQPYVYVPGGALTSAVQVTGFSDRLDFGAIERARSLRTVVFRYRYETPTPIRELRFKVETYDRFTRGGWRRGARRTVPLSRERDGFFRLGAGRPQTWIQVWAKNLNSRLALPVETTAVDVVRNGVVVDEAGAARLLFPRTGTGEYRAGLQVAPVASRIGSRNPDRSALLDTSGLSPRTAALAATVLGDSVDPAERIGRLEAHLQSEYVYTSDFVNDGEAPVEQFLFETRRGHCELFASAMVLMLRSQGIEARLATGFLGADYNPLEEYFMVRRSNAHAWVEAFVPGRGWLVFDPTPADARPQSGRSGWLTLAEQAYDYLVFRWDRYVLTYGFSDQVNALFRFRDVVAGIWDWFRRDDAGGRPESGQTAESETAEEEPAKDREASFALPGWRAAPLVVVLLGVGIWILRRRERFSATRAYRELRASASRRHEIAPWTPPAELGRELANRHPEASTATRTVVRAYLRESFAGTEVDGEDLDQVRSALDEARRALRKSA